MGKVDYDNWNKGPYKITTGCRCSYCSLKFNFAIAYHHNPQRALGDGELEYLGDDGRWFVGPAGCLKANNKPLGAAKASAGFYTGPVAVQSTAKLTGPTGFNCKTCNQRNDYAQANQPNGTYICYNCR